MALDQKVEIIIDNFLDAYKQCVPGTMQHVDQLINQRRDNSNLRDLILCTADGGVYSLDSKDKKPTLRITREALNPLLKHIEEIFKQVGSYNYDYTVSKTDFEAIKQSFDTVTIDLTKLNSKDIKKEWCHINIPTCKPSWYNKGYDRLNPEERKLAERVYGQGYDFVENMQMLNDEGINGTSISVLNPGYVCEHAKENAIVRPSYLFPVDEYTGHSNFNTGGYFIVSPIKMCGVRKQE